MKKTKIAIIYPKDSEAIFNKECEYPYGGGTLQMFLINKEMLKYDDLEVYSLIQGYENIDFDEKEDFNLENIFYPKEGIFRKILSFHRTISKIKPQVIIQRGLTIFSCFLALYCKLRRIKYVFMFAHDVESERKYQTSRKKCRFFFLLSRFTDLFVVQNDIQKESLLEKDKKRAIKIKKVLSLDTPKQKGEKKYDGIWIGRCEEPKRPGIFLDLVQANPKRKFIMICPMVEHFQELHKRIKKRANGYSNLEFYDYTKNEDIYYFIDLSKVLVTTSESEGDWPMVVLEAACLNVPTLSYSIYHKDLVEDYSGAVYTDSNFEKLNEQFNILIEDEKHLKEKGENAYKYVRENNFIDVNVKKLVDEIGRR